MPKRKSFSANQAAPSFDWGPSPTPFDTDLGGPRAVYFNAAGDVTMKGSDGTNRLFKVLASQTLGCGPSQIITAGTTVAATDIILLF